MSVLDRPVDGGPALGGRLAFGAAVVAATATAAVVGGLVAQSPQLCLAVVVVSGMAVTVWVRPVTATVLLTFITPLVAGIDRGRLIPGLRPNEALVAFVAGVVVLRALVRSPTGARLHLRVTPLEATIIAMAVANSVIVIAAMLVRGQQVEGDDISYALVLWKYLALYALVRATVRTEKDIRLCLWAGLASAAVVGVIGMLQALDLAGVRSMLGLYVPFGYTDALSVPRGGATLGLPAATADLLILNLVVATGLWWKDRRARPVLLGAAVVCMGGTFAAAEFSSLLGLLIAVVCVDAVRGRLGVLRLAPFGLAGATVVMWPVVEHRLSGFDSASGVPDSWTTRLYNLETYFFPDILSGSNPLFGVRAAARVVAPHEGLGFVWIESGYVWLLWGGGLPLLLSFVAFVVVALRMTGPLARRGGTYTSVAALAAFVGVVVVAVLMLFDPHITYRGSADWLFTLLAMTTSGVAAGAGAAPGTQYDGQHETQHDGQQEGRQGMHSNTGTGVARGWTDEPVEVGR